VVIRQKQFDTLSSLSYENFLRWLVSPIRQRFLEQYSALGEAGTEQCVRFGVEQARDYGIQGKRDLCAYIDLMFVFGFLFDRFPWAHAILKDTQLAAGLKAAMLIETADLLLGRAEYAGQ
jgi:hypothetical protein